MLYRSASDPSRLSGDCAMPSPHLVYWDANVFLEAINADKDALALAHAAEIKALLEEAEAGEVRIFTSLLSTVEVSFAASEKLAGALNTAIEEKIARLFAPESSPVIVVEVHPFITDTARKITREAMTRGWTGLRSADAVHLATAQRQGVAEFHTYESRLVKFGALIGATVCEPRPYKPRLLTI